MQLHEDGIRARGVTRIALFGSIARDESTDDSDIDIVVDIDTDRRFSLIDLSGLRLYLCDVLAGEIDVVIREDLRPKFRARIAADELRVF